jgi:hypothetical protein
VIPVTVSHEPAIIGSELRRERFEMKKFIAVAVLVVASVASHAATDVLTVRPLYIALKRASIDTTTAAQKWQDTVKTKGWEASYDDYVALNEATNTEARTVQSVLRIVKESDNATKQAFHGLLISALLAADARERCDAAHCKLGSTEYNAQGDALIQMHRETLRTLQSLESEHPELASE